MAKKLEHTQEREALTAEQERFCQLYVCGGMKFAGQLSKCYKEVFGEDYRDVNLDARRLVREPLPRRATASWNRCVPIPASLAMNWRHFSA